MHSLFIRKDQTNMCGNNINIQLDENKEYNGANGKREQYHHLIELLNHGVNFMALFAFGLVRLCQDYKTAKHQLNTLLLYFARWE